LENVTEQDLRLPIPRCIQPGSTSNIRWSLSPLQDCSEARRCFDLANTCGGPSRRPRQHWQGLTQCVYQRLLWCLTRRRCSLLHLTQHSSSFTRFSTRANTASK